MDRRTGEREAPSEEEGSSEAIWKEQSLSNKNVETAPALSVLTKLKSAAVISLPASTNDIRER